MNNTHSMKVYLAIAGLMLVLVVGGCAMAPKGERYVVAPLGTTFTTANEGEDGEEADADAETDEDVAEDSGSKVKLKTWAQRKGSTLGYEAPSGRPVPLIDRVHRLMHLWKAGDLQKVDEYLDGNGLRRQELFKRLLQSLIELSPHGSEERSLLESISNHIGGKGAVDDRQLAIPPGG